MKKENFEKLKPYFDELNKFVESGYYTNLTSDKTDLFKEIYKDETSSNEYNKSLTCNRCKLNLATDIYNLIIKHNAKRTKTNKR